MTMRNNAPNPVMGGSWGLVKFGGYYYQSMAVPDDVIYLEPVSQ